MADPFANGNGVGSSADMCAAPDPGPSYYEDYSSLPITPVYSSMELANPSTAAPAGAPMTQSFLSVPDPYGSNFNPELPVYQPPVYPRVHHAIGSSTRHFVDHRLGNFSLSQGEGIAYMPADSNTVGQQYRDGNVGSSSAISAAAAELWSGRDLLMSDCQAWHRVGAFCPVCGWSGL